MAYDTPATIAIVGAGPIGIETALYARFLGYDVRLLDKGEAAAHVRQWGHVQMFTPFSMNCSPLGLAALAAQDESFLPPEPDRLLTGRQWVERYLAPLAGTDLLSDSLRQHCRVLAISRRRLLKGDAIGQDERGEDGFRLLLEDADGCERTLDADIVVDAAGVYSDPGRLGPGGAWAVGERALESRICRGLPDVLGGDRPRYEGRHTLVVGSGYSAATTIQSLAQLREQAPQTEATWLVRRPGEAPVTRIADDRLPARDAVAAAANAAARSGAVRLICGELIQSLADAGGRIGATLTDGRSVVADNLVAHVGFGVDSSIFRELQVHQCYASEGPMKLAAALLAGGGGADCLDQPAPAVDSLRTPEPNFYVLGAKSYGRNSQFLFQTGLQQIKELFALIGDRATLDLYAGAQSLPQ